MNANVILSKDEALEMARLMLSAEMVLNGERRDTEENRREAASELRDMHRLLATLANRRA